MNIFKCYIYALTLKIEEEEGQILPKLHSTFKVTRLTRIFVLQLFYCDSGIQLIRKIKNVNPSDKKRKDYCKIINAERFSTAGLLVVTVTDHVT